MIYNIYTSTQDGLLIFRLILIVENFKQVGLNFNNQKKNNYLEARITQSITGLMNDSNMYKT